MKKYTYTQQFLIKLWRIRRKIRLFKKNQTKEEEYVIKKIFTNQFIHQLKIKEKKKWDHIALKWRFILRRFISFGGYSFGNRLTIFHNGSEAFKSMWNSIEEAKQRVWLETYIFEPDTIGLKTLDYLIDASKRGCDIKLLYDSIGSRRLNESHLELLKKSGGTVINFNPLFTWQTLKTFKFYGNYRNHRKVLIIDNLYGFTGGMNIGNDYTEPDIGGNSFFRDTHVKLEGPAVESLAQVFLSSLNESRSIFNPIKINLLEENEIKTINKDNIEIKKFKEDIFIQVLGSNYRREKKAIQKSLELAIKEATTKCYITTPYFLPTSKLRKAILECAKNGTNVIILTSGISDVPIVQYAGQHLYKKFLKQKGIRIFEFYDRKLHAKSLTIDGLFSCIGSYNLDPWSHFYNLEICLNIIDINIAQQIEEQFFKDLKLSKEITLLELLSSITIYDIEKYFGIVINCDKAVKPNSPITIESLTELRFDSFFKKIMISHIIQH